MTDCGRRLILGEHTMRTFHLTLAVLALSSAASVFAQTSSPDEHPMTRAQVKQELIQAEQQGQLSEGDNYPVISQPPSSMTRKSVEHQVQTAHSTHSDSLYSGA
jgi:uncharacterized protein YceK